VKRGHTDRIDVSSALPRHSVQHGHVDRIGWAGIIAQLQMASTLVGTTK
jgi:hypothetical protein